MKFVHFLFDIINITSIIKVKLGRGCHGKTQNLKMPGMDPEKGGKMKAIITVSRNEALKSGLNNEGDYIVEFNPADLTQEQREELALSGVSNDSGAYYVNHGLFLGSSKFDKMIPPVATADVETMKTLLDARIKARAAKEAEKAKAKAKELESIIRDLTKWVNAPENEWLHNFDRPCIFSGHGNPTNVDDYFNRVPGLKEAIEDRESLAFWVKLENTVELMKRKRINAEREAAEKKAEMERAAQIRAWVAKNGTQNQKARLTDSLLPDKEIIDEIRAEAYKPLEKFPRYKKLRAGDVCEGTEWGEYHDVEFDAWDAKNLTAEQYEQFKAIQKAMPTANVTPRKHTAECDECEIKTTRIGFMVRVKVGAFEFSREYGMAIDN